jgi:hypothetical protein
MQKIIILLLGFFAVSVLLFCTQPDAFESPTGYDISKPKKFILKRSLHEISGIIILNNTGEIAAIQDEEGKFFHFHLGDENYNHFQFAKRGDYEDLAMLHDKIIAVLRSDGTIFTFTRDLAEKNGSVENTNLVPTGEYEGLAADGDKFFLLCKICPDDNQKKEISLYILGVDGKDSSKLKLQTLNQIKIDLSPLNLKNSADKRPRIHPSGLAKHPITHEWYIISSVNKLLMILDEQWKIKRFYQLDPGMFRQPEGITFDTKGNLYISNEGGDGEGNILQFDYNPSKS